MLNYVIFYKHKNVLNIINLITLNKNYCKKFKTHLKEIWM